MNGHVIRKSLGVASTLILATLMFMPAHATTITEYTVPGNPGLWDLSVDESNKLVWFTESAGNNVGYLDYSTGSLKQIPIPTTNSYPWGIAVVPAGVSGRWQQLAAVFTESYGNKIGVVAANESRNIAEYAVPTAGSGLRKIIFDPYRNCAWFTEYASGKIGRFGFVGDTWLGEFIEYAVPGAGSNPIGIVVDKVQRYVWVADFSRKSIVRLDPENGVFREYSVSPFSPWDVAVDLDGMVWFTAQKIGTDVNVIGRLNPVAHETSKWSLTLFSVPTPNSEVHDIEIDSHGYVWFTEFSDYASKIGRYTPHANVFTEYPIITPNAKPQGLANSTEGGVVNVWFTEYGGRRIGRLRQPEGPTVSTTVYSVTKAVTTSTSVVTASSGTTTATPSSIVAYKSTPTVTTTSPVVTTSSTVVDTVSIVLTSPTYWTTTRTSTTSTSFTTSTTTYTQLLVTTETTSTTTSRTVTYVSTSWESVTAQTSTTVLTISWFSETTSTTATATETLTVFYPTITVPTTTMEWMNTTVYSPTVTLTSTTLTETSTTTTSTTTTTTTSYSPTVTLTSITTTFTTLLAIPIRPCVIASAAYESELAPEVQSLRTFRDSKALLTFAGGQFMRAFNTFYYSFSPAMASMISSFPAVKTMVRVLLYPLIGTLRASSSIFDALAFVHELGVVAAGFFASTVIGIVYVASPLVGVKCLDKFGKKVKKALMQGAF